MSTTAQIAAVAALDDGARRALYDYVCRQPDAVGRDAAATALELPRTTAAFHLDRLVELGLLETEFRRLSGRSGPGAGRPAKLYRRAAREVAVTLPPRDYPLAGELLAGAVTRAERTGAPVRAELAALALETGRRIGAGADSLADALDEAGYQPCPDALGGTMLANCPFHRLASAHTELICEANAALLRGVAEGVDADPARVERVAPPPGGCCVRIAAE